MSTLREFPAPSAKIGAMVRFFRTTSCTVLLALVAALICLATFRVNAMLQETMVAEDLKPENGRFVETPAGALHVTVWGEGNATPVVMTHGMAAWGGLWEETAMALAAKGYRVIAVDQPPFGFSERTDEDFSRSRQAARLDALAEAMALERYLLVGHSYGGGVAMETALRYPKRIKGLVLVCPVINLTSDGDDDQTGEVPLPLRYAWLGETLVSASITNPFLTGFLTKRFMHQTGALSSRHVEILQRPMKLHGNTHQMTLWLQQFLAGDADALSRDRTKLQTSTVPVELIWGGKDTVTPIAQGEELVRILSPKSFRTLSEIGHMPQLESPAQFNTTLLGALNSLRQENE